MTRFKQVDPTGLGLHDLDELNKVFKALPFDERIKMFYQIFDVQDVLFTSSFGSNASFLIRFVSMEAPTQKVHFIDTTYHFAETISYRNELIRQYKLEVVNLLPSKEENNLTREEEWWKEHPKMCCAVNKVSPLSKISGQYKLWISGVMGFQTKHRAHLSIFEMAGDIVKFHPLVDIEEGDYLFFKGFYNIPDHPLLKDGYDSIGCSHCTIPGKGRDGRWAGKQKSECGLHVNYFYKNRQ